MRCLLFSLSGLMVFHVACGRSHMDMSGSGDSAGTSGGGDFSSRARSSGGAGQPRTSTGGWRAGAGTVSSGGVRSNTGSGGSSSSRGGSCAEVTACGGDVVGTWEVKSQCLNFNGEADIAYLGLTCVPNLASINGSLKVSGRLTLGSDGRYKDATTTTGSEVWSLDKSCLILSGTKIRCQSIGTTFQATLLTYGYQSMECGDAVSGGGCTCAATINTDAPDGRPGGMGILHNDAATTGRYKTNGNALLFGDSLSYTYCVKGDEMTVSPIAVEFSGTPYSGTIVLARAVAGTGGTGGSSATGGSGGGGRLSVAGMVSSSGGSGGGGRLLLAGTVSSSGGSGGVTSSTGSGGSSSSRGGSCAEVTACGGDVVGTWEVKSHCLAFDGQADITYLGLACMPNQASINGSLKVSGRLTLGSDGRYEDATTTTGSESWLLDKSCLNYVGTTLRCASISNIYEGALMTFGYESMTCGNAVGGCSCSLTINTDAPNGRPGGMGILHNDVATTGPYRTDGNKLLLGNSLGYTYCVKGDEMTVSPIAIESSATPYSGTIVLTRSAAGTGGTGGSSATGGNAGSGGGGRTAP